MPKYWGKQIFSLRRFPEVGRKSKDRERNTPLTMGGRKIAYISTCYAKILGETNFQPREIPRSESKAKEGEKEKKRNTPGTRGGSGSRYRTLAIKRRKNARKSVFFFVKR